jgi:integrase
MPPVFMKLLRSHKARQATEKLRLGALYQDNDLVCAGPDGSPVVPHKLSDAFRAAVTRVDVPKVTFHGLRHTHATILLRAGVHPKVVSERLGHSTIAITLDVYSHVVPDMQAEAAEAIERVFAVI